MSEKVEIVICLGSSCFARGNKKTVQIIDKFIKDHKLEDRVYFHGNHCFGSCESGPNMKINNQFLVNVSSAKIIEILKETFQV